MTIRSDAGSVTSGTPSPGPSRGISQRRRTRARFAVHLGLLAAFAASMATVTVITEGWPHLVVGLAFVALAGVHVGAAPPDRRAAAREPRTRPLVDPPQRALGLVGRGPGPVDAQRAGFGNLRSGSRATR